MFHRMTAPDTYPVKNTQGRAHEGIYRRAGNSECQLHHRRERDGETDCEEVWNFKKYSAQGCRKMEIYC